VTTRSRLGGAVLDLEFVTPLRQLPRHSLTQDGVMSFVRAPQPSALPLALSLPMPDPNRPDPSVCRFRVHHQSEIGV